MVAIRHPRSHGRGGGCEGFQLVHPAGAAFGPGVIPLTKKSKIKEKNNKKIKINVSKDGSDPAKENNQALNSN